MSAQAKAKLRNVLKQRRASFFANFTLLPQNLQLITYEKITQEVLKIIKPFERTLPSKPLILSGFYPIKNEINCLEILHSLAEKGYKTALPITLERTPTNTTLEFREYIKGITKLTKDVYNVPSPDENSVKVDPDVILTPLLGFDSSLNRIGYGGGYYDRTFLDFKRRKRMVLSIGICWDIQKEENIPMDEKLDCVLDYIITDMQTYSKVIKQ